MDDLSPVVTAIASLGFSGWLAWHLVTVAIPRMQERHEAERRTERQQFLDAMNAIEARMSAREQQVVQAIQGLQDRYERITLEQRQAHRADLATILHILRVPGPFPETLLSPQANGAVSRSESLVSTPPKPDHPKAPSHE